MFRPLSRSVALALALAVVPAALDAQTLAFWNFDDLPVAQTTPFSQTKNGVTADFSAAVGPADGFIVGPFPGFLLLSGNVLVSAAGQSPDLGIAFSSVVDSLDFSFALNTQDIFTSLTVETFLGLTPVATINASGFLSPSGFVEGIFATANSLFDRIVISSDAPDFAIDGLNVRTAAVPEPGSLLLLATGLLALGGAARRRQTPHSA